ncbi:zf-HC2 domain-containing protein [Saccharopolyspora taberi]|uniref:Zinc-finger domain-containing protein n=1 Tax=Saccharopolyspora taberi TaxID=60895 RepID=A0ABN3V6S8_9PSEU
MDDREHEELRERLRPYADGLLEGVEWLALRTHVAECERCRTDLIRPRPSNRALPQRIPPATEAHRARLPFAWRLLLVTTLVVGALVLGGGQTP